MKTNQTNGSTAFTLVEILVSVAAISLILLLIVGMTDTVAKTWTGSEKRIETYQNARVSLELMTREMTSATIDTCQQFVVMPAETLRRVGAQRIVSNSHAATWVAPLGKDGDLRYVGYFLERDDDRRLYRLKRIYVGPENEDYFPPGVDVAALDDQTIQSNASEPGSFVSVWDGDAFDDLDPENKKTIVGTVADGVIALWFQCIDALGNPIPWASAAENTRKTNLMFNSAAYFHMATSVPFEDGTSFKYLPDHPYVMKGNRLPAAVEITLVTLDSRTLAQDVKIPVMVNVLGEDGVLDLESSQRVFEEELAKAGIHDARTFSATVKLMNGS